MKIVNFFWRFGAFPDLKFAKKLCNGSFWGKQITAKTQKLRHLVIRNKSAQMVWNGMKISWFSHVNVYFNRIFNNFLYVPKYTLSVNEITQKVRKLLRKCIKFCVVFWKHYAARNKFLRSRQISTLRHKPHLCHHCINGSFCPTGIRVCVICQLFPWRFWITEQINERFFEDCPNAARLLILSKQKRP